MRSRSLWKVVATTAPVVVVADVDIGLVADLAVVKKTLPDFRYISSRLVHRRE